MKITKSQLHKVIQEELQAELNEEVKLPGNLVRLIKMVIEDAGDGKVLQKIQQLEDKLSINFQTELADVVLSAFGVEADETAMKTALNKGKRANVVDRMKGLEGEQGTVGVSAGGPPPQSGGGAGAGLKQALQGIK
jgi:hypothetical protein